MNKIFTLILFLLSDFANATPVTFYFELPDWTTTQPAWPYGDNANVSITLDNGNSSVINQIYLNSDILEITVSSGSFINTWLASDILDSFVTPDLSVSYFSTDVLGAPILDLTGPGDTRVAFENSGGFWAFGTREGSGPTTTWLEDAPNFNGFWAFNDSEEGFVITGTVVPIPDSDGDGINDDLDECIDSDLAETVVIGSCDSSVINTINESGCTIVDHVNLCEVSANNHGQFVSCTTSLGQSLVNTGEIHQWEQSSLVKCSASQKRYLESEYKL